MNWSFIFSLVILDPVIQWSLIQFFQETRAARNRFSDYFHCCGISLVRFLITTVLNIISSLHIVFSFCARTGWCDVWTEFTNSIKVEVDVNVHLCAIYHTILSLAYMSNRPHKHTHTKKKETVCLMTSAHPTFIIIIHDECTSFLITQLSKNKRKFIPKLLKVHLNWIQLYLYSASLRNQYKLKP